MERTLLDKGIILTNIITVFRQLRRQESLASGTRDLRLALPLAGRSEATRRKRKKHIGDYTRTPTLHSAPPSPQQQLAIPLFLMVF
jgi:hypothetical protein